MYCSSHGRPARAATGVNSVRLGIGLCLTSAKDGTGVNVAMEAVAMLALENKRRRQAAEPEQKRQTVVLDELHARPVAQSASCCK